MSRALLKRIFTDKKRIPTEHGSVIRLNSFPIRVYPFACFISIAILSIFLVLPKQTRAASYITGRFGKALSLDGTGDYVDMGDVSSTVKTVDFWVSPNTTTQKFLELNGSAYIDATSGTVAATGFTSPTIYVDGVVSSTLTTGWHHIAVTTGTGINGNSVIVGKIATTYFTGLIDSVRMYDRTLSASEIAAHYSLGRGKHDNYAAKIKLAANDSNSYLDESLTSGQDYLASFWYHPGEDNANAIRFKVSGLADPIMAEHNLMASSTMGLVGAWNFEEDPTGTDPVVKDLSGNGNNGTTSYVTADWVAGDRVAGKYGYAYDFNGSTDGRYVTLPTNTDTGLSNNENTYEFWIYARSFGPNNYAEAYSNGSAVSANATAVMVRSTTMRIYLNTVYYDTSTTISVDTWYHIAVEIDHNNDTLKIFKNGSQVGSTQSFSNFTPSPAVAPAIGLNRVTGNSGDYFNGLIDSVRIYNRALTASEVYDRYKAGDWHKYELSFEADQTGAHLFKFIQDGSTSGNSIVYVDNFRVDKNLVDKGGFEGTYTDIADSTGTSDIAPGWSAYGIDAGGSDNLAEETSIIHSGGKSQKIIVDASNEGVYQSISGVTYNKWYTQSAWVKVVSGTARMWIGGSGDGARYGYINTTSTNWTKLSKTFRKTTDENSQITFVAVSEGATFYVDDVSLIELDDSSTYTDPTTTTPSTEANSYTTGKWSDATGSFLIDGGDRLRYSAGGVLPNDAGTVSVWWKPVWDYNKFGENVYLINAESASANLIRLFYDKTNYYYTAQLHNGTNWTTAVVNSAAQTFSEDAWQHIILSYDNDVGGSVGSVVLYVNGASSGTPYSSTNWTAQTVSDYFYVGSLFGASANTNQAGGWFDDFRIYSSQLSAANINALYGLDPNPPTTATWKRNLVEPIIAE